MNENNYDNLRQPAPPENQNHPPQIILHSQNAFYNHSRLILVLFRNVSIAYASSLPPFIRRFIEFLFLTKAFLSLFILVYIHMLLVKSPITCLDHLRDFHNNSEQLISTKYGRNCLETFNGKYSCSELEYDEFYDLTGPKDLQRWPRDGILRVEVTTDPVPENYSLKDSYDNELLYSDMYVERPTFLYEENETRPTVESTSVRHWFVERYLLMLDSKRLDTCPAIKEGDADLLLSPEIDPNLRKSLKKNLLDLQQFFYLRISEALNEAPNKLQFFSNRAHYFNRYIMEYSLENGLLRLSPSMREKLNVSVKLVVLNPNRQLCFDENLLTNFVFEYVIGYNDVLIGSLKRLSELSNLKKANRGFVHNVVENSHYRFVSMSYSRISYLVAIFVMIVFTFSVSILFRYSHHQIFVLINDMIRMLQVNIPFYVPAAPLMTLILALIAVETMMSEFFGDSLTAFYLIIIVSFADRFEAVFCHSPISKKYWPRFFLLYHFLFYAYNYRFNGQHSHLALLCSWLFTQHSMIYFFHHYDLPYLINNVHVHTTPSTVPPSNGAPQQTMSANSSSTSSMDHNATNGDDSSDD